MLARNSEPNTSNTCTKIRGDASTEIPSVERGVGYASKVQMLGRDSLNLGAASMRARRPGQKKRNSVPFSSHDLNAVGSRNMLVAEDHGRWSFGQHATTGEQNQTIAEPRREREVMQDDNNAAPLSRRHTQQFHDLKLVQWI